MYPLIAKGWIAFQEPAKESCWKVNEIDHVKKKELQIARYPMKQNLPLPYFRFVNFSCPKTFHKKTRLIIYFHSGSRFRPLQQKKESQLMGTLSNEKEIR